MAVVMYESHIHYVKWTHNTHTLTHSEYSTASIVTNEVGNGNGNICFWKGAKQSSYTMDFLIFNRKQTTHLPGSLFLSLSHLIPFPTYGQLIRCRWSNGHLSYVHFLSALNNALLRITNYSSQKFVGIFNYPSSDTRFIMLNISMCQVKYCTKRKQTVSWEYLNFMMSISNSRFTFGQYFSFLDLIIFFV